MNKENIGKCRVMGGSTLPGPDCYEIYFNITQFQHQPGMK